VKQAQGFRLPSVTLQEIFTRTDSPAEAFAFKLNQERFSFADFMTSDRGSEIPPHGFVSGSESRARR